eukprot:gene4589-4843_t
MSWTKQWWPLAVEESLDQDLPHKVTLLGRDLVLWKAANGTWSCLDNACPHRYTWRFPWLARDAMVSYEYGLDNLFDIAHGPFAHDGVFGISAANNAPELPTVFEQGPTFMSLLTIPSTKPGEKMDLTKSSSIGTGQKMTYNFPVMATADNFFVNPAGDRTQDLLKLVVYRTPVRPGVSKVFYNMLLSTSMDPKQRAALTNTPAWDLHAKMLRFFDGDVVLIHDQERLVASKGGWRKAMFMPHPSDRGIAKFRAWFDKVGPIPYAGDTTLGPIQPRHVVLNHYDQHVKQCKTCQQGIAMLMNVQKGLFAAAALIGLLSLKAARLAPGGPGGAAAATFLAPYVGLAIAAGLVVAAFKVKQYIREGFFFKDYVQSRSGR